MSIGVDKWWRRKRGRSRCVTSTAFFGEPCDVEIIICFNIDMNPPGYNNNIKGREAGSDV